MDGGAWSAYKGLFFMLKRMPESCHDSEHGT
jgi:hypothetical protein